MAHAVLESTEPLSGSTSKQLRRPGRVPLQRAGRGQLRRDPRVRPRGARIDAGEVFHPGGRGPDLGAHLKRGAPKGSYTATYRVISADSHPVAGGLVFTYGKATDDRRRCLGAALAAGQRAADVTDLAFGVAQASPVRGDRGGGRSRLLPARDLAARAGAQPPAASAHGARHRRRLRAGCPHARCSWSRSGRVLSGMAGIVLQGAKAAGVSFWSALDSQIVGDVLDTRFGTVWGIRMLVWLGFGAVLLGSLSAARRPVLRPASVGATGLAPPRLGPPVAGAARAAARLPGDLPGARRACQPGGARPGVLIPANAMHVLAMSIWAAGLALLLFVLPARHPPAGGAGPHAPAGGDPGPLLTVAFASRDRAARHRTGCSRGS